MKKKLLIGLAIPVVMFLAILILVPLFLEARIGSLLRESVNNRIEGQFDFEKASLSLISSFPNAALSLDGSYLVTKPPFEGDTLFFAGSLDLKMGIAELFKSAEEPLLIKRIVLEQAKLYLSEDEEGRVNYDIVKEENGSQEHNNPSQGFSFSLNSYEVKESEIRYSSRESGIDLNLFINQHSGSGDLALKDSKLDTRTEGTISLALDSLYYLHKTPFTWQALIGMDLESSRYRFLDNKLMLQQLALVFDGEVQVGDDYQEYDIRFETPSAKFQDFLSVLPEGYMSDLNNISADGDFEASGFVTGRYTEETLPLFGIDISTEKANMQYSALPRAIENISFSTRLANKQDATNKLDLQLKDASFKIGEDDFDLDADVTDVLGERKVDLSVRTNMNLARLGEAYPLPQGVGLRGSLNADIDAAFSDAMLKRKAYGQIKFGGTAGLRDFVYTGPEFAAPLNIAVLNANFTNDRMAIQSGRGSTGQSDFEFTGSIYPILGYQLGGQDLQGKLKLRSNTFVVSDFVTGPTTGEEQVPGDTVAPTKIPENLNLEIEARAGKVVYNELQLDDFQGTIRVNNGAVDFQEVTTGFLDGKLALQGSVNTRREQPQFALALDVQQLQIQRAFNALDLFQALVPVAGAMEGRFSSQLAIAGDLTTDFRPDLSSLTGEVLAEVLAANMKADRLPVLDKLNSSFNFFDLNKLDLKGAKTALAFEKGKVRVKPFGVKYEDISIRVEGGHGFDRSMDYQVKLQVPSKYLGPEIQRLVASIGEAELNNLKLPVQVGITGSLNTPQIKSDMGSGVRELTNQLLEIQKQQLLNKGKSKAEDLIGGVLGKSTDTAKTKNGDAIKGVLDVLGKTPKDSTTQDSLIKKENPLEDQAKGLLKGLLKKKKKDTVN